jgi:hypothetical protein
MGDPAMTLGPEELQKIGDYVRLHLAEWMGSINREREMNLIERLIRIEEEIKAQRETMDTRFEAIQKQMDVRFEAVDKRFTSMQWMMGLGFTLMAALMGVFNFF